MFPGAPPDNSAADDLDELDFPFVLPSGQAYLSNSAGPSPLTPLVANTRAISGLLETILERAGLSKAEMARRLGVKDWSVRQYTNGKRLRPSLIWFLTFCEAAGARVSIEFPETGRF